jgi:hypothetical protein
LDFHGGQQIWFCCSFGVPNLGLTSHGFSSIIGLIPIVNNYQLSINNIQKDLRRRHPPGMCWLAWAGLKSAECSLPMEAGSEAEAATI